MIKGFGEVTGIAGEREGKSVKGRGGGRDGKGDGKGRGLPSFSPSLSLRTAAERGM
jgi:hypothetical protein